MYAITILWPQVKEASTRIQTYANNEAITAICENRTVYKDLNIHHTYVTLSILTKLGIFFVYQDSAKCFRTVWRSSNKCKIAHNSQSFCFAPHKPTSNLIILKANLGTIILQYKGFVQGDNYFCWKSFAIQDSQSFHGHEQSSRTSSTSTVFVFLTSTFLFVKF